MYTLFQMNVSELQATISRIKNELRNPNGEEENKHDLRKKVVILQLRLHKMKELAEVHVHVCTIIISI